MNIVHGGENLITAVRDLHNFEVRADLTRVDRSAIGVAGEDHLD
jgi:hypothetical protein